MLRLFLPRLAFLIEPLGSGICLFRAEIVVRLPPISRWLHRKEFVLVRRHMAEEGENLKRILERPALSRADPA